MSAVLFLWGIGRSGHAVDLFGPAIDVADWAGVLSAVMDVCTPPGRGHRGPARRGHARRAGHRHL